jgi:hypothetical protein
MTESNTIDLSPYNVLICVPAFDARLDCEFVKSLRATERLIEQYGGKTSYLESRHCADIHLARNKLFGNFYRRPEFTHMLQIDSDMDWNPNDVAYMLLHNRDFIAAAGPRKKYPIDFAVQLCDDRGKEVPMMHELETNVAEVTGVGAAFMMMNRNCAEKMVSFYQDLQWDNEDKEVEYALFDPIIINCGKEYPRRRFSDDYAFCHRWRKIGGKVFVMLDVELGHTGSHRFKGRLMQTLIERDPHFNEIPDEI